MAEDLPGRLLASCETNTFFRGWYCNGMSCSSNGDCESRFCDAGVCASRSGSSGSSSSDDGPEENNYMTYIIVGICVLAVIGLGIVAYKKFVLGEEVDFEDTEKER